MILATLPFFPQSASKHADRVDYLFAGLLLVSVAIVLFLTVAIIFCVIHYRAGSTADRTPLRISSIKLEITWAFVTAMIFMGFFAWGASLYLEGGESNEKPDEIYVVARQWMWDIRYPDGRREHNRVHVAVGRPVKLIMTSEDVIHSFYVPALRMKQDVVPGRYVTLSFTPNRTGDYNIFCAEYCGTKHSAMLGKLIVKPAAEQAEWLAAGAPLASLAEEGRRLFATAGCAGCHAPGAAVHAPMLDDLYGRTVPLADGSFVTADAQYIHDSILLPLKQVVAGYAPVMPSYTGQLKETEVLALVEYIKTLHATSEPPARPDPEMLRKYPLPR